MRRMTRDECLDFLMARPRTAKLATVRPDGRPHVVPIWFDLDGEQLLFTTGENTVKARNLRHSPWVSLCVDDETPPFAYVKVDGTVEFSEELTEMLYWATRIGGRYMGADQAEVYGRRNAVTGELLVRVSLTSIFGETDIAGW